MRRLRLAVHSALALAPRRAGRRHHRLFARHRQRPLSKLAEAWTAETGNKVTFAGFNVGRIRTAVGQERCRAMWWWRPTGDFTRFRAQAGAGQRSGRWAASRSAWWSRRAAPHPDISTHEKFVAFIKKAGVLAFANPAGRQPDRRHGGGDAQAPGIRRGGAAPDQGHDRRRHRARRCASSAAAPSPKRSMAKDAEVVGPFPDDLGLHVDVSAAVLKVSAAPSDAEASCAMSPGPRRRRCGRLAAWSRRPRNNQNGFMPFRRPGRLARFGRVRNLMKASAFF